MTGRDRPADYFHSDNSEFLEWLDLRPSSVLDVGCAAGFAVSEMRRKGATRIVGIEVDSSSAQRARQVADEVHEEPIEQALGHLNERFDLVICADVLEHLVDPWSVAKRLTSVLEPGGRLAVSFPNIRYYRALARIAVGKAFRYDAEGIFDATHLRFFTRSNMRELLEEAGWRVLRWGSPRMNQLSSTAFRMSRGWTGEWLSYQWYVLAEPRMERNEPPTGEEGQDVG